MPAEKCLWKFIRIRARLKVGVNMLESRYLGAKGRSRGVKGRPGWGFKPDSGDNSPEGFSAKVEKELV
jgi:hypothetical protein